MGEREFAINVHAIDKITKFATQIYCTANRQAEPLSARACLWVGGLVPGNYNRNSDYSRKKVNIDRHI